jgi:hypothetical protein
MLTLNLAPSPLRFPKIVRDSSQCRNAKQSNGINEIWRARMRKRMRMQTKAHSRRQSETTNHLFSGLPKLEMKIKKGQTKSLYFS